MVCRIAFLLALGFGVAVAPGLAQPPVASGCDAVSAADPCTLLANFESDSVGNPPMGWHTTKSREPIPLTHPEAMGDNRSVYVHKEQDNQFARIHTEEYGFRVVRSREQGGLDWNLDEQPYLRWRWRAKALPDGANEKHDATNDTGGALYVTFETDILGQPKSIKYTYSSTLPVGTTVEYGTLKVLVVASKQKQGLNDWIIHERNVVEDYERLFGEPPDSTPLAIMMWSDSDSVDSVGTIDFDDLLFLSEPSRPETVSPPSRNR